MIYTITSLSQKVPDGAMNEKETLTTCQNKFDEMYMVYSSSELAMAYTIALNKNQIRHIQLWWRNPFIRTVEVNPVNHADQFFDIQHYNH